MKPLILCLALGLTAVAVAPLHAAELEVRAPVVDVQPLGPKLTTHVRCPAQPSPGAGLVETLAWDLGVSCTTEQRSAGDPAGYRVFYRWDDRVYSRVMANRPGETIPLRVRLD